MKKKSVEDKIYIATFYNCTVLFFLCKIFHRSFVRSGFDVKSHGNNVIFGLIFRIQSIMFRTYSSVHHKNKTPTKQ